MTLQDLDQRAFYLLWGGSHGAWATAMIALSALGSGWVGLLLMPLLAWKQTRAGACALFVAVGAQAAIVWLVKRLVGRVRPWIQFGLLAPPSAPHDHSFPSGHASASFCVAAFVLVTAARSVSRGSRASPVPALAAVAVLALAALVGVARVYLGAHFPGDVLGGALLGGVFGAWAAQRPRSDTQAFAEEPPARE